MAITSKKVQSSDKPEKVKKEKPNFESKVKEQVLDQLGTPPELYGVTVFTVAHNSYRVNVRVRTVVDPVRAKKLGLDTLCEQIKIAHSYFIKTNDAGQIVSSNPEIKKEYHGKQAKTKSQSQSVTTVNNDKAKSAVSAPKAVAH